MRNQSNRHLATALVIGIIVGTSLSGPKCCYATGVKHNIEPGTDIIMKDLRWPGVGPKHQWDAGTYYCFWYVNFFPESYTTFYGGLAVHGPDNPPGMFVTYWATVNNVFSGDDFYGKGYGAEGSKGGVAGAPSFVRPNSWYRMVLRVFSPKDDTEEHTYVGWWIKDLGSNRWYNHHVVRLDARVTGVAGNGGFVEALAAPSVHRSFERRLGYGRLNGQWYKANVLKTDSPHFFKLIEDGTVLRYDRSRGDGGKGKQTVFAPKQPDAPVLDQPAIENLETSLYENQIAVNWAIPQDASPQLGYKIEAFDGDNGQGRLVGLCEESAPYVFTERLDTSKTAKSIRLTVTDIFDQTVSRIVPIKTFATPSEAATSPKLRPGLRYSYYEAPDGENWRTVPDFSTMEARKRGIVKTIDDTIREDRDRLYGVEYDGYIQVPKTGVYVFELGTCDGSIFRVDGQVVAKHDGIHSPSLRQTSLTLAEGLHRFNLKFFRGTREYMAERVLLRWEGPGFGKKPVTPSTFVCDDVGNTPRIVLPDGNLSPDGIENDNLITIQPKIETSGHVITKVEYFRGHQLLAVSRGGDGGGDFSFSNLVPEGASPLWARLWYYKAHSVDSDVIQYTAENRNVTEWAFDNLDESATPLAVRAEGESIAFRGEGFGFGHQKLQGDFTLTAHVADIDLSTQENGVHRANWLGLYVQNDILRPFHGSRFGIYCTAGLGNRGAADYPDLAGTYMSRQTFPHDRWLRITRNEQRLRAFSSPDGVKWTKVIDRYVRDIKDETYVGVVFRSVPGKSRSLFSGVFDHVSLTRDAITKDTREKVRQEDFPRIGQVLAIVQGSGPLVYGKAPEQQTKDPQGTLYARTLRRGILKSVDQGDHWISANGTLAEDENAFCVRSLAVHPIDDSIVLCATGAVVDGELRETLYRSTDAGKSWKFVSREIDFDGEGPSTIFGEVVSFCPESPNLVVAAGESSGVYLSQDAGLTWQYAGLKGHRVACLAFQPQARYRPTLYVGTIPDQEFETVGLEEPHTAVDTPGGLYRAEVRDDKLSINKCMEWDDLGITNIAYAAENHFATFATTRGIYYTWQNGNVLAQRRYDIPINTLYTALGYRQFMYEYHPTDWRIGSTAYAAPFSSDDVCPIYKVFKRASFKWERIPADAWDVNTSLHRGVTCFAANDKDDNMLYLCNQDGVFKSVDGGKAYRRVCACQADMGPLRKAVFAGGRLQPEYNSKAPYLPIPQKW